MLEWVLFLSQLGLWVMVIQLYRTRAQDRQNLQLAAEQKALEESAGGLPSGVGPLTAVEFDFLDTEAITRMATIRTLLDEIEERAQRVTSLESATRSASISPIPSSAEEREELTAFTASSRPSIESAASRRTIEPLPLGNTSRFAVVPPETPPHGPRSAVSEVRSLASTGLDAPAIARSTGRQLEEVNLLLHLATPPRPPGRRHE